MDTLLSLIENYEDIFVFGYGTMGRTFYNILSKLGTGKSLRYCDSNFAPNASPDAAMLTPDEAVQRYPDALFCIGSVTHSKKMSEQLVKLGVPDTNIIKTPVSVIQEDRRRKYVPRTSLENIEYHLVEHCNLNCAGCLHFSNIAREEFADLQTFHNDIMRFNEIFNNRLPSISLCGGEPLLHPQVGEFVECARQLLPATNITVVTNGILLLSMPDSFYETLKRNRIGISITKYPIKKINIEGIYKKTKEYGIPINTSVFAENWNKHIFDISGKKDPSESFELCPRANGNCLRLYKGRLYPCAIVGNAEHFNRKFEQNMFHTKNDSIDIYSEVTPQDIFNFLASPIPFCRYCDLKQLRTQKWMLTKREINEYL